MQLENLCCLLFHNSPSLVSCASPSSFAFFFFPTGSCVNFIFSPVWCLTSLFHVACSTFCISAQYHKEMLFQHAPGRQRITLSIWFHFTEYSKMCLWVVHQKPSSDEIISKRSLKKCIGVQYQQQIKKLKGIYIKVKCCNCKSIISWSFSSGFSSPQIQSPHFDMTNVLRWVT